MPDGTDLAFSSGAASNLEILLKAANGTGDATALVDAPAGFPNSVSPDGKHLLYHVGRAAGVMVKPLDPIGDPWELTSNAVNAVVSPDGHWVAYQSERSSPAEVVVSRFPEPGASAIPVSRGGGRHPLWSRDGSELFYIDGADQLVAVEVSLDDGFSAASPEVLFSVAPYFATANSRSYDVSADGQFIFAKLSGEVQPTIMVVSNWFEEVATKVGGQTTR